MMNDEELRAAYRRAREVEDLVRSAAAGRDLSNEVAGLEEELRQWQSSSQWDMTFSHLEQQCARAAECAAKAVLVAVALHRMNCGESDNLRALLAAAWPGIARSNAEVIREMKRERSWDDILRLPRLKELLKRCLEVRRGRLR